MIDKIPLEMIAPGASTGFYSDGVNPIEFLRVNGRGFFGEGSDTFDGATRNNNSVLDAWVHTFDEGNNIFGENANIASPLTTQLTNNIGSGDTSFDVDDPTGIAASDYLQIGTEVVQVGSVAGSTLSGVTRAHLGTTAAAHTAGDYVYLAQGPYGSRIQYAQTQAWLASVSRGGLAISGAAISTLGNAIGVAGFGRLDSSNPTVNVWGSYDEVIRGAGTLSQGSAWARETGVINFAGDHPTGISRQGGRPYLQGWQGQTLGWLVQSGGGNTNAYNADNPMVVGASSGGAKFWRGITFEIDSIENPDVSKKAEAILMPSQYTLTWYEAGDTQAFNIFSSVTSAANAQELAANDTGLIHRTMNGSNMFVVEQNSSWVNYPRVAGALGGGSVKIKAEGTDASIDLQLQPKGSGRIKASYAAAARTLTPTLSQFTHRLEIKDGTGTTFYVPLSSVAF